MVVGSDGHGRLRRLRRPLSVGTQWSCVPATIPSTKQMPQAIHVVVALWHVHPRTRQKGGASAIVGEANFLVSEQMLGPRHAGVCRHIVGRRQQALRPLAAQAHQFVGVGEHGLAALLGGRPGRLLPVVMTAEAVGASPAASPCLCLHACEQTQGEKQ